ncbi:MAG: HEAT repeat domain-containing protein [Bacteroidetes bacterium]|nr:HEAT repeat domain-containing protein [Bacteroidota bacterium]
MMKNPIIKDTLLFILATVFSVALMYVFIELPRWIDTLLHENVGFPGFDQGSGEEAAFHSDLFIKSMHLRWIGYGSLVLVCLFIAMGFVTRKSSWAWAGAFVIFLPVFGQFALSMFFLSGLGILRTGWLPFIESGFPILDLGMVIYVPYWILMWFIGLFDWDAYHFVCWLFMSLGAFLFVWGVFVWLQSRLGSKGVATRWIYKISRHPQYLGWIIWSYGLMLFSMTENNMKKSWGFGTSFPWLIMTMIIIAICMIEELSMKDKYGEEYDEYRKKTPFLFPLPKWMKAILKAPMKLITKEIFPQNRKQVAGITLVYTFIFMIISLIWLDIGSKTLHETLHIENPQMVIDSINTEIQQTFERRELYKHFNALGQLGVVATPQLIAYLTNTDPVLREFAANQLGHIKSRSAIDPLILALSDENWRVRNSVANALADIGDKKAIGPIMELIRKTSPDKRSQYYSLLGTLGATDAWPFLLEGLVNQNWYAKTSALKSLTWIDAEKAKPFIYKALEDSQYQVRRQAVFLLLEMKPEDAIIPLQQVLDDDDFETRFYAKEALKLIELENK